MGKQSVLDIIINTVKKGGGDKDTVKGLTEVKSTVKSAVTAFAALAGVAFVLDKTLDATAGKFVDYASEVRNVQFATGASADESSRLIQVADDAKVSYESLTKAMTKAVKEGVTPNIDGLAQLADQYVSLAPGQERAAFLLEKFGKSGADMAELMSKGGVAIRTMSAGIDESLVLTQEAVDQAREYEIAMDALNEQWEAFTLNLGEGAVPVLTKLIDGTNIYLDLAKHEEETYKRGAIYRNTVETAIRNEAGAVSSATQSYMAMAAAQKSSNKEAESANVNYKSQISLIQQLNDATLTQLKQTAYRELQQQLQESGNELTETEADLLKEAGVELGIFSQKSIYSANKVELLNQQLADGVISIQAYVDALNSIPTSINTDITTSWPENGPDTIGPPGMYATGGSFKAGRPMMVHQDEIMVPSYDGVVLTRTDAMRLMSGQGGGREGGGKTFVFNGSVTIIAQTSIEAALEELGA